METQATSQQQLRERVENALQAGSLTIKWGIYLYGLYALFLLLECIDFLAYLHTPEPGFHATYSVVHVAFFIVELIVYASITLGFIIQLNLTEKKPGTVITTIVLITAIRMLMIYYLYWQTEPEVHFIPYIYKTSNEFSGLVRGIMLPAQIIWGIVATWKWISISRKVNKAKGKTTEAKEAIDQATVGTSDLEA